MFILINHTLLNKNLVCAFKLILLFINKKSDGPLIIYLTLELFNMADHEVVPMFWAVLYVYTFLIKTLNPKSFNIVMCC